MCRLSCCQTMSAGCSDSTADPGGHACPQAGLQSLSLVHDIGTVRSGSAYLNRINRAAGAFILCCGPAVMSAHNHHVRHHVTLYDKQQGSPSGYGRLLCIDEQQGGQHWLLCLW